jgi:hypothetical protein
VIFTYHFIAPANNDKAIHYEKCRHVLSTVRLMKETLVLADFSLRKVLAMNRDFPGYACSVDVDLKAYRKREATVNQDIAKY